MVPAGLAPPAAKIPPIAIIETGLRPRPPRHGGRLGRAAPVRPLPERQRRRGVGGLPRRASPTAPRSRGSSAPRATGAASRACCPARGCWVYGSSGLCQDVATAIRQAVRDGARVINASYGFGPFGACREHRDATSYAFGAGATVVAASGNFRPDPAVDPARQRPPRADGQRPQRPRPADRLLAPEPLLRRLGAGRVDPRRRPDLGGRRGRRRRRLLAVGRHQLRGADGERRGGVGPRRRTRGCRPTRWPRSCAARPATSPGPGWDISTGWGALDLGAAVRAPAPLNDPYEPNDDIRWIYGRSGFERRRALPAHLGRAPRSAPGSTSRRTRSNVYPVWVPAGGERLGAPGAPRHGRRPLRLAVRRARSGPRQGRHRQEQAARRWRARR